METLANNYRLLSLVCDSMCDSGHFRSLKIERIFYLCVLGAGEGNRTRVLSLPGLRCLFTRNRLRHLLGRKRAGSLLVTSTRLQIYNDVFNGVCASSTPHAPVPLPGTPESSHGSADWVTSEDLDPRLNAETLWFIAFSVVSMGYSSNALRSK